jgi:hypothetical protein
MPIAIAIGINKEFTLLSISTCIPSIELLNKARYSGDIQTDNSSD